MLIHFEISLFRAEEKYRQVQSFPESFAPGSSKDRDKSARRDETNQEQSRTKPTRLINIEARIKYHNRSIYQQAVSLV